MRFRPSSCTSINSITPKPQEIRSLSSAAITVPPTGDAFAFSTTALRQILKRLEDAARLDESLKEIAATLAPALIAVDESAHSLRHYIGKLEADPARLDEIETRMAMIEKLKRKYGATLDHVITFGEQVRRELAAIETSSDRQTKLAAEVKLHASAFEKNSRKLSEARKTAAQKLARKVETELGALAMDKTRVEIRVVASAEWAASGVDSVEFLIAPNLGEELKPLEKIASGGELSRVALALKTCTAPQKSERKAVPRTFVFDEVDAGVGGAAAESVGRRLKKLAASAQVLCVTHLPQIAGFADHHYYVEKHSERGRTVATIEELEGAARAKEIGRMLSGERVTPEALKHAEQILKLANKS